MNSKKQEIEKALDIFYQVYPIVFEPKKHRYILNNQICAGISTVSEYAPKDYLKFWSAKLVAEFLRDKQELIKTLKSEEYLELLLEAKNQHAKRSKDALEIGEKVHQWIEDYVKLKAVGTKVNLLIDDDIKNPVEEFLKFEKEHKIEWLISEKIVGSSTHLVAGRLDSLAIVDGLVSLVDFKTSNQIDENYFLQTAGYQFCCEEMGIKIEQRIILRLPKKIGDGFEAILVETDYLKDKEAFLNRRYAWQWANYVDANFKEEIIENGYKVKKLKLKKYNR